MTLTNAQRRERYEQALELVSEAFRRLRVMAADLPVAPREGRCGCGSTDFHMVEIGYVRYTAFELVECPEPGGGSVWHGTTDGWDDMSEGAAGPEVLTCAECDTVYRRPEEVEWD